MKSLRGLSNTNILIANGFGICEVSHIERENDARDRLRVIINTNTLVAAIPLERRRAYRYDRTLAAQNFYISKIHSDKLTPPVSPKANYRGDLCQIISLKRADVITATKQKIAAGIVVPHWAR